VTQQLLWPLLALASGIVGFLFRGYFGSYVSEKGKNIATREDIKAITLQVEGVKSSIQMLSQLQTDYEQQRRDWLLSFYDAAVELLHEKLAVNFGDLPSDDGKSLFEFQQSFSTLVVELLKRYQRIVVYFDNDHVLRTSAEDVVTSAVDARKVVKKHFGGVKLTLVEECEAYRSGDRDWYHSAVEKSNVASCKYWDTMSPVAEKYREQLQAYLTNLNIFIAGRGA